MTKPNPDNNPVIRKAPEEYKAFEDGKLEAYYRQEMQHFFPAPYDKNARLKDYWKPTFVCFLTQKIFENPVKTPWGIYERKAIEAHLEKSRTDPFCGRILTKEDLIDDLELKPIADDVRFSFQVSPELQEEFKAFITKLHPISKELIQANKPNRSDYFFHYMQLCKKAIDNLLETTSPKYTNVLLVFCSVLSVLASMALILTYLFIFIFSLNLIVRNSLYLVGTLLDFLLEEPLPFPKIGSIPQSFFNESAIDMDELLIQPHHLGSGTLTWA